MNEGKKNILPMP